MSRAFRVTIDFVEVSHSELPAGKFEVRVTSDGIYLRASAARRWRFLSWEDAAISACWSEAPRSRAVADELTEANEETSDPPPPQTRCPEPDGADPDERLRQFIAAATGGTAGVAPPESRSSERVARAVLDETLHQLLRNAPGTPTGIQPTDLPERSTDRE